VAIRVGPSRLISTAESSGESNDTAAAEWMTTSQEARTARSASDRPSPSVLTSPAMVVMRRAVISSNVSSPSAHDARSRSKASFFNSSRWTRRAAGVRLPSRTSSTSSHSGTLRSSRSTSAVPTKPVDPVMAIRVRDSASAITGHV
jgi:hypothetical protein